MGLLRAILVAFVLVVGVSVTDQPVLTLASNMDWCEEEPTCGPTVSCEAACWTGGQGPPFETTCGGYGGWFPSIYGACLGECGDGTCNPYNDEDYDTCSDDCGWCGDGMCQRSHEATAGSGFCESDCGTSEPNFSECNPQTSAGCGSGDLCNAQEKCVSGIAACYTVNGLCHDDDDCCPNDKCYTDPWWFTWNGHTEGVCLPTFIPQSPQR